MSNKLPPDVPGNASPHKLLSFDEMTILQEHYRLVGRCKGTEDREKALKGWTERQRSVAMGLYARLLQHGFVVEGQHESGTLLFGIRLKSATQMLMELSDVDLREYRAGRLVFDAHSKRFVRVGQHAV